jgi:SAM-dependent methyltransferase
VRTFLGEITLRHCPVCGSEDDSRIFATQKLDVAALDDAAFGSRKKPERMHLRMVICPVCDLVYAPSIPSPESLANAYKEASFDSEEESRYAARTYAEEITGLVGRLPDRVGAIDIGTGEGAMLGELIKLGFSDVVGIEPSTEPIAAAAPEIAAIIEHRVFGPDVRAPGSQSLVTCFQTIEHVPDPAELVREAAALLKPRGIFAMVCHDRRALLNRLLGLHSPIIDVQHMQLFSPQSVAELLGRAGLRDIGYRPIRSRYPMRYWARLLPLPEGPHAWVARAVERTGLARRLVTVSAGNLFAWGVRHA